MQFNVDVKYSEIEVVCGGEVVGTIKFNAYDVEKRKLFYDLYAELSSAMDSFFSGETDKFGVPRAFSQEADSAAELFGRIADKFDGIFGAGSLALLTNDNKDPAVLMQFLVFAAGEFRRATGLKIEKYTKPQVKGGVMQ